MPKSLFPDQPIPPGKLPAELLKEIFQLFPQPDQRVLFGPGVGVDCAVVQGSSNLWVVKTDPITFATDQLGWYLVQVNANDIATTGATPRWLMVTLLLPEGASTPQGVEEIAQQVSSACREIGVSVIGGHTEVTTGINRPIAIGTMIGEVEPAHFIHPGGSQPGDRVLLTQGVPIEATAILSREFAAELSRALTPAELASAQDFLYHPGISVVNAAHLACASGQVTAMHDPTEGGLATALWELAEASQMRLSIDPGKIGVPPLSRKICDYFGIDPLGAIASGSLLLTAPPADAARIQAALAAAGIPCADLGETQAGPVEVITPGQNPGVLERPARDEIARVFEMRFKQGGQAGIPPAGNTAEGE